MSDQIVVEFKIEGLAELQEMLEERPPDIARKIMRDGLRLAVKPWWYEMKQAVAQGWHVFSSGRSGRTREFGFISKHVRINVALDRDELAGTARVGPVKKAFWMYFLEFGSSHEGAQPFIRKSAEAAKGDVLAEFIDYMRATLAKGFQK